MGISGKSTFYSLFIDRKVEVMVNTTHARMSHCRLITNRGRGNENYVADTKIWRDPIWNKSSHYKIARRSKRRQIYLLMFSANRGLTTDHRDPFFRITSLIGMSI